MSKQAHTPGPWQVVGKQDISGAPPTLNVLGPNGKGIAFGLGHPGNEVDSANAALIASAPDLLAQRDALLAAAKRAFVFLCAESSECAAGDKIGAFPEPEGMSNAINCLRAAIAATEASDAR